MCVCALAHIIHEGFCCNRGFAAATCPDAAGSPLGRSTYCFKYASLLATPRACLAWRLRDFATNRHEYCGLVLVHDGFEVTAADHLFIEQLLRSFEKRGLFVPPAAVSRARIAHR